MLATKAVRHGRTPTADATHLGYTLSTSDGLICQFREILWRKRIGIIEDSRGRATTKNTTLLEKESPKSRNSGETWGAPSGIARNEVCLARDQYLLLTWTCQPRGEVAA